MPGFGGIDGVVNERERFDEIIKMFNDEVNDEENVQINAICLVMKGCETRMTAEVNRVIFAFYI